MKNLIFSIIIIVFLPAIVMSLVWPSWPTYESAREMFYLSLPGIMYLAPLMLICYFVCLKFYKVGKVIFILFNSVFLIFSIYTLSLELMGPLIGYIYIPTISISFVIGLIVLNYLKPHNTANA